MRNENKMNKYNNGSNCKAPQEPQSGPQVSPLMDFAMRAEAYER